MAKFLYKAKDFNSKTIRGEIEAQNSTDAVLKLRQLDIVPVDVKENLKTKSAFRPKSNQLAEFCREISLMLASGIPIVKTLGILINSKGTDKRLVPVYSELHRQLKMGVPLSEAMRMQGGVFPELMINMFLSGEMTGDIALVADRLSKYYESDHRMKNKISAATVYPKVLGVLTVLVILVLFVFVLPTLLKLDLFQKMELPLITKIMIGISDFLTSRWYVAAGAVIFLIVFFNWLKSRKSVKLFFDKNLLNLPKLGTLLKKINTARFSMTLSYMYSSGIQLVSAVSIASKTTGNSFIEKQLVETTRKLRQGEMLSASLQETGLFSDRLTTSLIIGEETGKLDDVLANTARTFEYESDVAISQLLSLLEPVLIVLMAVVIGSVVLSVMLPILRMYSAIRS